MANGGAEVIEELQEAEEVFLDEEMDEETETDLPGVRRGPAG